MNPATSKRTDRRPCRNVPWGLTVIRRSMRSANTREGVALPGYKVGVCRFETNSSEHVANLLALTASDPSTRWRRRRAGSYCPHDERPSPAVVKETMRKITDATKVRYPMIRAAFAIPSPRSLLRLICERATVTAGYGLTSALNKKFHHVSGCRVPLAVQTGGISTLPFAPRIATLCLYRRHEACRRLEGAAVNPSTAARSVQVLGAIVFVVGAILMKVDTTSISLFIFFGVLAIAGLVVFFVGQKMYVESIGK